MSEKPTYKISICDTCLLSLSSNYIEERSKTLTGNIYCYHTFVAIKKKYAHINNEKSNKTEFTLNNKI